MNADHHIRAPGSVLLYGFLLSSTALFFGFNIGIWNPFFKAFIELVHNVTDQAAQDAIKANINFCFVVGGTLACLAASFLIELLGRYRFLLLLSLAQIVVGFGFMVPSIPFLYACRVFAGFLGCASTFICPLMIKEILPDRFMSQVAGSFYIFLTGGILVSTLFSSAAAAAHWRLILALPSLLEIPKLLAYLFFYRIESPKSIVARSAAPQTELYDNYLRLYTPDGARLQTDKFMEDFNAAAAGQTAVTFSSLFGPQFRLAFLIGLLLNFLNQATGINFLVMYSTDIFRNLGFDNPAFLTSCLGFINFMGAIYITLAAHLHKKRSLLVFGLAMQSFAYFVFLLGFVFDVRFLIPTGAFLFMASFSISLGGTLYSYLAETVPAVGISFAAITQWALACLVALFALPIMNALKEFNTFYIFMVVAFLGCVVFAGYSVQTEGKTEAQIQAEFRKKQFMY